jgi:hypothetical protein
MPESNDVLLSIESFCERNAIGRSQFYIEPNAGRLVVHKIGRRTVVLPESERAWRNNLPKSGAPA